MKEMLIPCINTVYRLVCLNNFLLNDNEAH